MHTHVWACGMSHHTITTADNPRIGGWLFLQTLSVDATYSNDLISFSAVDCLCWFGEIAFFWFCENLYLWLLEIHIIQVDFFGYIKHGQSKRHATSIIYAQLGVHALSASSASPWWIIDSGATEHMTILSHLFTT